MKPLSPVSWFNAVAIALYLICSAPAHSADLAQWKTLLHYHDGQSLVKSGHFFLHQDGNTDYLAELDRTVELLDSDEGEDIACRFPARYNLLTRQGLTDAWYDLARCGDLSAFKSTFPEDILSLVFATEQIDDPAAAFGHLLLMFKDSGESLEEAEFIHFYVQSPDEPFLTYVWKGLFGGYTGRVERLSFEEIRSFYMVDRQRALNIYQLNLEKEQVRQLINHLYELEDAGFDYYFLKENCAFHIARLLDIVAMKEDEDSYRRSPYVLPIQILSSYKEHIVAGSTLDPTLLTARKKFDRLSPEGKTVLKKARRVDHDPVKTPLTHNVNEILFLEKEYLLEKEKEVPEHYQQVEGSGLLSRLVTHGEGTLAEPSREHRGALLGVGASRAEGEGASLLRFRMYGKDLYEIQSEELKESALSLLDFSVFKAPGHRAEIEELVVLRATSLFSRSTLPQPLSWSIYLGRNRENSAEELSGELLLGIGMGAGGSRLGGSLMIEGGIREDAGDGSSYYAPRADVIFYIASELKAGAIATKKFGTKEHWAKGELIFNIDLGKAFVTASVKRVEPGSTVSHSLMLNFPM